MINLTPNKNIEKLTAYQHQATIYWKESLPGELKGDGKLTLSKVAFWNDHLRKELSPNSDGFNVIICISRNKDKKRYSLFSVGKQEIEEGIDKDSRYIPLTWIIKLICQEQESEWINPRSLLKKIADYYFETPQKIIPLDNVPSRLGKEVIKLTSEEAICENDLRFNFKECLKRIENNNKDYKN